VRELELAERLCHRLQRRIIEADAKYGDEGLQLSLGRAYWEVVDEVLDAVARLAFMAPTVRQGTRLRIYIAGPYMGATDEEVNNNVRAARAAAAAIYRKGHAPFCPHTMTSRFERLYPDISRETYLETDLEWLRLCHAILMLPGWERSDGACGEYEAAKQAQLRIFHSVDEIPERML